MVSDEGGSTSDEGETETELAGDAKRDRIEALVRELHGREHHTFLEIQFASLEAVYQSYPQNHNIAGLTDGQREALQDLIDEHDLTIIFEDGDGESTTVTATHDAEPTVAEHVAVVEDVVGDVYDVTFADATLAFLGRGGPDDSEPLLWTDVELEADD